MDSRTVELFIAQLHANHDAIDRFGRYYRSGDLISNLGSGPKILQSWCPSSAFNSKSDYHSEKALQGPIYKPVDSRREKFAVAESTPF